ncbi:unnamed protein product [Paramecium pentaurelia]|uniref:Uncharacterized protein n=1 Tax=Paramecium pentaurelia TaxID=43138 RepID=A0A8S1VNG9_9CILI|nr:unnamed protein product [Paramecium pentaurelia]
MSENQRTMTLTQITHMIEEKVTEIQANPDYKISELPQLIELLKHDNVFIVQMTIMALTDLFIDIAPLYKIDQQAHEFKITKFINKEEKQVLNFELSLIKNYYQFIKAQFTFVKLISQGPLVETCYQSLGKLLNSLFHFNYNRELVQYVTYGLLTCNDICYNSLSNILSNKKHSLHEAKLQILTQIQKLYQTKHEDQLPDNLVDLVNQIQIDTKFLPQELEKQEKEKKRAVKQKKREYFSQKEKDKKKQKLTKEEMAKQKKLLKEVQDELQEAQGDLDKKTLAKNNGEILSKMFYIYFKVLKLPRVSKYYESALNGILQYVHLINIELIQGIFECLLQSTNILRQRKDNQLKYVNLRLQTILALQSIMDGPASVFGIDDKETMQRFYVCLLDIWTNQKIKITEEEESLILRILDSGFIKKRHFSQEVTGSYVKILIQLAKNSDNIKFVYALCYCIKLMTQKYQKTQKMLEEDNEGFGINSYNVKCDDPSCTNALNSSIYEEVKEIKNKFNNQQKLISIVSKLLKNEPVPQHMLNKSVYDVYRQ